MYRIYTSTAFALLSICIAYPDFRVDSLFHSRIFVDLMEFYGHTDVVWVHRSGIYIFFKIQLSHAENSFLA